VKEPGLAGPGDQPNLDDLTLMDAVAAGDRAALATLYGRHAPLLLAVCRRVLGDADEADDVLVDVFFEVWTRADRYDASRGSPMTYLVTLARSRSIDRRRSIAARPPLRGDSSVELAARAAGSDGPLQHSESAEMAVRVRAALVAMDPDERTAVECAFFEGLTHTQVAAKLGRPLGSVKTAIRQGLIHLREILRIDS
jgi:RNA polymerase sigma-70 factor (ECF subfamily)